MRSSTKRFRLFEFGVVAASALLVFVFYCRSLPGQFGFLVWALLPYATYFLFSAYLYERDFDPLLPVCACITSVVILVFTLSMYIYALFIHRAPLSGMVFVIAPFFLLLGGPAILCVCLALGAWLTSLRK